jgi:hypothetical protein
MSMAMAVPTPIDRVAVKLTSTTGICRVAGSREPARRLNEWQQNLSIALLRVLTKYSLFIEVS